MAPSGSEPAFEVALRDVAWVSALSRRLARDGEAEDLAQDTWLAALEAPGRARDGLRQWLSGVARFLAVRRRRRARPEPSDALDQRPGDGLTDELVQQAEFQEHVLAAVRALGEPYRATVLLRYYEGLALEEVARRTGVPGSTARTRLARAHEQLRARLDHEFGGREAWSLLALPGAKLGMAGLVGGGIGMKMFVGGIVLAAVVGFVGWELLCAERRVEVVAQGETAQPPPGESSSGAASESVSDPFLASAREALDPLPIEGVDPSSGKTGGSSDGSSDETVTIRGRVLDPAGQPVAKANLFAILPDANGWSSSPERVSDEQGHFELRGLERREWRVGAHHPDALKSAQMVVDARKGDVDGVELRLHLGGCIQGKVRWPDGSPALLGRYELKLGSSSTLGTFRDGAFRHCGQNGLDLVVTTKAADWSLQVTAQREGEFGHASLHRFDPDQGEIALVLETLPTFAVDVAVVDPSGAAVEFALSADSTLFRATRGLPQQVKGSGRIEGLFAGGWRVKIWAIGYRTHEEERELFSSADALRFTLDPLEPVRGRVVDPDGRPAAGARIREGYGRAREAIAGGDGTFELAGMPTTLHLTAVLPGFAPAESTPFEHTGEANANGPVLVLRRAHRAAGRVLDADGHALAGVQVKSSLFGTEPASTAPDGSFELVDLPAGAHTLWLTLPDDTKAGPFPLSIGATPADPIELRLPPR